MDENLAIENWPEWGYFSEVSRLLKELIAVSSTKGANELGVLYPLLDAVQESSESLAILVRRQALRDSYVIARVVYETSVNACFLLTDVAQLSERARVHAAQKSLRSLVRQIELSGKTIFEFKHSAADALMQQPDHREWLDEFTTKSGREITSWTPETVQQRLERIELVFGAEATRGLAFGLLLYRHASEIAHGTLYGTLFSWGAMEPRPLKESADLGRFRRGELRHVLKLTCFSLESLICVLSAKLGTPALYAAAQEARLDYYKKKRPRA